MPRKTPTLRARRRPHQRRGNALILVTAVLVLLAILGTAYIVRTQGSRDIASAQQQRGVVDDRTGAIAGALTDEVTQSLFVKWISQQAPIDPIFNQAATPGVIPTARSDWPRFRARNDSASRYNVDSIDTLRNLIDPGDLANVYVSGADGYPDGYNFAPYSVRPYTNWPDTFGSMPGESNPLGNPGFGDLRWLASFEPQRAINTGSAQSPVYVPDPQGTTFTHWAHLSWIPTAENGWRVVRDISNVDANTVTGPQGTPATVPADPTSIATGTSLAALGVPYEQWLPNVPPAPLTGSGDFVSRRNSWFTPGGYYQAVHGPFGSPPNPNPSLMLPNLLKLNDLNGNGTILEPGERPTDEGPTRFLASGLPDDNNNTIRNVVSRTLADADGDGVTDSFWYLVPGSVDRSVKYVVAARIIDNSAMLNVNVASRFDRQNTAGHTPADLGLVSNLDNADTPVGFFNDPENSQATGFYASSPQLTVAFDNANWAGTAEDDPSFLRERGVVASTANTPNAAIFFPKQLKAQTERARLFKSALSGSGEMHFFNAPAGSGLAQPNATIGSLARLQPFSGADELELRMNAGQNQPFVLSRLERALNSEGNTYAFLRSSQSREEASEWTGKQLTLPEQVVDNRRKLTTVSGARTEMLPPALWTRWWSTRNGQLIPIDPDNPDPAFHAPLLTELRDAYPTLQRLQGDLGLGFPPAIAPVATNQVFSVGGYRPETIRSVAGDANDDGIVDARDVDYARRDFELWNRKLDLRAALDVDDTGSPNAAPVVDPVFGIVGRVTGGVFQRGGNGGWDEFDVAFRQTEWIDGMRRRLLRALKSVYENDADGTPTTAPIRTVSSYADRFQIGSDMPAGGFQTLTGTVRPRSIVADNQVGKKVDNALKSEAITNAMAASLSANAAAARDHAEIMGTQQPLANQFLSDQPLLPAYPGPGSTGLVPDTRAQAVDPDPTLPANASPSAKAIYFSGVEAHPVIMEAFVAVVWPKTRLGSEWQYKVGTLQPSALAPKPADPYSVPTNYYRGGNESHFVAIVPKGAFVDQQSVGIWAETDWQRQSTAVIAVQVANPYPHPIRLADYELNVFGNIYRFPVYEVDETGATVTDAAGNAIPLTLGPCTEVEPRTAIVFAISDHNQINYKPGDSPTTPKRYPLTKGVEFDPFFRARWLDYLDIVEATDLGGSNPNLQTGGLSGAAPSEFCPHNAGLKGTEASDAELPVRRPLLGGNRTATALYGAGPSSQSRIRQTKVFDATSAIGTDVAAIRPDLGISLRRRLFDPASGTQIGTQIVDRFDQDPSDTDQSSADPVTGWNISLGAAQILDQAGRFWPPRIDANLSGDEDQMHPLLNAPPAPPPPPQPPHPWHLKPQQSAGFNGIRLNANDYYVTWTRSSRLWGKDFAVVYGSNGNPVAYDRQVSLGHGKGDGAITPDEQAPRFMFASAKQRPDLPLDGGITSGPQFADGQGPFPGRQDSEKFRGAAFQGMSGLTPWVQDLTQNYGGTASPYPLPPILINPAQQNAAATGFGDPDYPGSLIGGFPLKGNQLLPFVRNLTPSLSPLPGSNPQLLTTDTFRVAMKPVSFPTKTVVGTPSGESDPRQIFGVPFSPNAALPPGITYPANAVTYLADKGFRPPVSDTSLDVEITPATNGGLDFARAVDALLPVDGAFTPGTKDADFDTVADLMNVMVWGPVYDQTNNVKHTLGEILTDRVPGYPVGMVHRYVDDDGDLFSSEFEQNPAAAFVNRLHVDNPALAFSWVPIPPVAAPTPPSQQFLRQWGGSAGLAGAYASSLPHGTRVLEAFTLEDRGTTRVNGAMANLPAAADLDGSGWPPTANEVAQWVEDQRFRLTGTPESPGTPGVVNVNTAPIEVLRAAPHMSRLVCNDDLDLDDDTVNDQLVDSDQNGFVDQVWQGVQAAGNPYVRVPESIDLYRSQTTSTWVPDLVHPSKPNRSLAGNQQSLLPNYVDRGTIPGDANGDNYQDTGYFPGMRAERGLDSLGELLLLQRTTAAPDGAGGNGAFGWDDNHSWSVRFAGLDPFRTAQADASNGANVGGGYRQSVANGPFLQPPYNARISTDQLRLRHDEYTPAGSNVAVREVPRTLRVAGDAREQNELVQGVANLFTTRSDVFTVYFRVKAVRQDPVSGRWDATNPETLVDDSRYVMCIDRTQVEKPTDAPRIVYMQKLPH